MRFPDNFTWGAAAAAYQIEGAAGAGGRGLSVWDMMCRQSGRIYDGHTGEIACDHYNRADEDVALMKELGLQAYRLSVAWPRVIPEGTGKVNEEGLGFYDRLVDRLLEAGIQPWVTLFHWDYPHELYCRGGWLNRESVEWFADYARVVVDRLSDRVSRWMTLNEPQCFIGLGHFAGIQAPGDKLGVEEALRAGHHALLAHGRGVQVIRERAKRKPVVGWAPVGVCRMPADPANPADVEAARRACLEIGPLDPLRPRASHEILWSNTWFGDPVVFGRYPEDGLRSAGKAAPKIAPGDLELIAQPLDFFGLNIYNGEHVTARPDGSVATVPRPPSLPLTAFKWPITPDALYWGPKLLHERYRLPIVITENGTSGADWVGVDGKVRDGHRIDFCTRYLRELGRAIADGADVRGYFLWSILDNFEWAEGYKERFGLVHVDYATQKRTPKDSAWWYRDVIRTNGRSL